MTIDISPLLEARSVAVIGASADPRKIGGRPIEYLRRIGYPGRIVPVNPARSEVQGIACLPDIAGAGAIDLAIVAAPGDDAREAVLASIKAGVKGIILFSAGFAEADEAGRAAQAMMAAAADEAGAVLLGPNCLGAINMHARLTATFTTALEQLEPEAGGFSYMGQSGALGAYWIEMAAQAGLGISKWISTGNEAQIGSAEVLAYLADDPTTGTIGAYIEGVKQPERFAEAARRAAANGKTILAIKSGGSRGGAHAALAHTASATGDDGWYDGFLRDCGIRRVRSLSEMIDAARILSTTTPPPPAPRLAIITVSGGAGVLACDEAERLGIAIADLPAALSARLATVLPRFSRPQNPVDVTGAVVSDTALMPSALAMLAGSDCCDAVLVIYGAMSSIADNLIDAVALARGAGKPLVVVWLAAPRGAREAIEALGIPVFADVAPALIAISHATRAL